MPNLPRTPVETLHHIATLTEQMAQQAQRADLAFVAYLLSMASQEAKAELKKAGFPITADQADSIGKSMQ